MFGSSNRRRYSISIRVINAFNGTMYQKLDNLPPGFELPNENELFGVGDEIFQIQRRKLSYDTEQHLEIPTDNDEVTVTVVLYVTKTKVS